MKILVVGDEAVLGQTLTKGLRERGHCVEWAPNVAAARSYFEVFTPDIVLVDKRDDGECGIDLCREMKASTKLKDSNVVIVSSLRGDAFSLLESAALAVGVRGIIQKPFGFPDVERMLERLTPETKPC